MAPAAPNKHQQNSASTREKLLNAAEQLYGSRSIDGVSFSEITAASGQRNRNALQYHFKNRDGILQAIIDRHSSEVNKLRERYIARAKLGEWSPAEAAARCLAMPIIDYIEARPEAVNFVRIVAQINAAYPLWQGVVRGRTATDELPVHYPRLPQLRAVLDRALGTLGKAEAQRRIYLAVNISFHSIADIYRSDSRKLSAAEQRARAAMSQQLVYALQSFFSAPSINTA